ncbi:unnamed protein product, partial [Rangifer tarandus platyrhynchus]
MQRPGEPGAARFGPPEGCADHRPHRYRSFMIEEILTEPPGPKGAAPAAAAAAAGELLKFGVQALLAARPFHSHLAVLKAEQAAVFKFPLAPLGCSGLGSALLAAGPGLPGAAGAPHLPLELQLRGKLEAPGAGEPGTKAKKGRRSRTVFTELQLMGLEKRFEKQKYLSTPDRIDLAESLGLSQLQVKTWYQNRRMKRRHFLLQPPGRRPLICSRHWSSRLSALHTARPGTGRGLTEQAPEAFISSAALLLEPGFLVGMCGWELRPEAALTAQIKSSLIQSSGKLPEAPGDSSPEPRPRTPCGPCDLFPL